MSAKLSVVLQLTRTRRMKPRAAVVVEFLEGARMDGLDPVLVPTDRLLERWAVSQGSDDLLLKWSDEAGRSRPPPLDDDMAIIVDQIVMHAQVQSSKFVRRYYLRPNESREVLARALGIHPDSVTMRLRSTLWYMRRLFIEAGIDV